MPEFRVGDIFRRKLIPNENFPFRGCTHFGCFTVVITSIPGTQVQFKCEKHGNSQIGPYWKVTFTGPNSKWVKLTN
jgi:hypothetical protein